ncbi:bifunctional metallophosphatase/5'-nucleotidase [Photobacterium sp. J15]|uniref:bifunctional metallophosphatase/5'-nucleotidase n=1 Tax=Photobacterium sp. J15 TaxID=265901 RepID=UPI0009FFDABA|nr:5'-nucleotidase C-terminal domain-containing protein [Photobacterium sp. J15]
MNRTKITKSILTLAVIAALTGCNDNDTTTAPVDKTGDKTFTMSVAHINDTHSNFDAHSLDFINSDLSTAEKSFKVRTDVGGYPRLAAKLHAAREAADANGTPFLALHGGDAFQGSLYFSLLKGSGNATLLSEMGLDAMAIGNHEFDLGNDPLISFIENVNFPLLAANLDTSADADMKNLGNLKSYTIKEFNGEKVGIFGLVLEDLDQISSPGENLKFNKEVDTAQKIVDELKAKGINKIVMVSHIGVDRDVRIAKEVNGVDLIVGGHSHTRLGDFTNLGLGKGHTEVSYAEIFTNKDGKGKTCVVQAGEYAEAVGQIDVSLSEQGELLSCKGNNTLLIGKNFKFKYADVDGDGKKDRTALTDEHQAATESFVAKQDNIAITEENQSLRRIIDLNYKPQVEAFSSKVIGHIDDAGDSDNKFDHVRIPGKKRSGASLATTGSEAGAHVAASMAWILEQQGYNVDMAITNTGGVRADIVPKEGTDELTAGYILGTLLPFGNEVALVKLTGTEVRELLETTINYATSPDATSDGGFPTTANLKYTYDGTKAEGSRIEGLQVCKDGVGIGVCADIVANTTYNIATTSFLLGGKDGYSLFLGKEATNSGFKDNQAMIDYVEDLTGKGLKLTELKTGLNYIPADPSKVDNPLVKPDDNANQ